MAENEIQKQNESPLMTAATLVQNDGNMDVDKLKELLELQERWDATQAKKAYVTAMAAFQSESPKIIKDAKGHNSSYAKLPTVISIVAPELSKNGLSHSWTTKCKDKQIEVTCKITHICGHCEQTTLSAEADATGSKNSVQALGSTITYLKRYTLEAALGLAEADQDDDGKGANDKPKPKPKLPKPNKKEQAALDAIYANLEASLPDDKALLKEKIPGVFYGQADRYPNDIAKTGVAAGWLVGLKQMDRWTKDKETKDAS